MAINDYDTYERNFYTNKKNKKQQNQQLNTNRENGIFLQPRSYVSDEKTTHFRNIYIIYRHICNTYWQKDVKNNLHLIWSDLCRFSFISFVCFFFFVCSSLSFIALTILVFFWLFQPIDGCCQCREWSQKFQTNANTITRKRRTFFWTLSHFFSFHSILFIFSLRFL